MDFEEWIDSLPDDEREVLSPYDAWVAATKAEREACAELCESGIDTSPGAGMSEWSRAHNNACRTRAGAIRMRPNF